jgi:YgiT-type zinc finger domain-containing protein
MNQDQEQIPVRETCYFCGRGVLEARQVTVDFRWGAYLVIIQDVPAKVCNECGERYYAAEVVRQMERIAKEGQREEEIRVPVVTLGATLPMTSESPPTGRP